MCIPAQVEGQTDHVGPDEGYAESRVGGQVDHGDAHDHAHMQGISQVVHTAMLVMAEASHRVCANFPMRFALTSDGRNRLMSNTTPLFTPRGLPRQAG